jgi:hypothetical protein
MSLNISADLIINNLYLSGIEFAKDKEKLNNNGIINILAIGEELELYHPEVIKK